MDRLRSGCGSLFTILAYRMQGHHHGAGPEIERIAAALAATWVKRQPGGLKIPTRIFRIPTLWSSSEQASQPGLILREQSRPDSQLFLTAPLIMRSTSRAEAG